LRDCRFAREFEMDVVGADLPSVAKTIRPIMPARAWICAVCTLFALLWCSATGAQEGEQSPQLRILAIYSGSSTLAANVAVEDGISSVFSGAERNSRFEIYVEYRDAQRFPDAVDEQRFIDALDAKYRNQTIDLILTIGPEAVPLALGMRERIAPGVPVVSGGILGATRQEFGDVENLHAVVSRYDLRGTFELARQMQPDAQRAVIFTGSADFDRRWKAFAEAALADVSDIEIAFVSDLSLQGFRERAAALDPSDILIGLTIFEDADGRRFVPADALASIAEVSAAPSYGVYSSNIGRGVVGGSFSTFEDTGAAMAEQALRTLDDPSGAAQADLVPVAAVLDWRQLRRYGLDPDLRPPDSRLLYYNPGIWERYKLEILLALAVILLQSSTIAALIIMERRRRRNAEELARRRMEMARLSRIAQLGELSGAIAHELNQPLTSILANAEAGAAMLAQPSPDLAEVGEVLRDIANDDQRAADVIVNLRRLMTSDSAGLEDTDLNEVVRSTFRLVGSEILARRIALELKLFNNSLMVKGDIQQLQQVLLNLVINAADAMADQKTRHMTIETGLGPNDQRLLSVTDTGPGLPEALRDNPFKPFATSKIQGMGLGLSISQTIAEAHGGSLRFVSSTKDGARVELALPAP